MCVKPLGIRFDKAYGVIKVYDGTRYLELFDSWIYNKIYYKINYLIGEKIIINIVLVTILQKSELIHIILYL